GLGQGQPQPGRGHDAQGGREEESLVRRQRLTVLAGQQGQDHEAGQEEEDRRRQGRHRRRDDVGYDSSRTDAATERTSSSVIPGWRGSDRISRAPASAAGKSPARPPSSAKAGW